LWDWQKWPLNLFSSIATSVLLLDGKGRISRKGTIKTRTLDFDDVYFYKELKYNTFSVSQMCDKKNNVLFTDTECLVLSSNFKLLDESQVLLRVLIKDNIYSIDLKSVVPTGGIKREFSVARTPQKNGVVEKKNRTLIDAARTLIVKETLNIRFIENVPNVKGNEPDCLFDIDSLRISMNYVPVVIRFQTNGIARTKDNIVAGQVKKKKEHEQAYIQITICTTGPLISQALPSPINIARTPACTNAFEEHPFERFSLFKNAFSLPHVPIVTPINDTKIFGNAYDDEAVNS
nr:ribonuclease H-like domain-containing protein [Tanacetum cinerariifolium]